LSPFKDSNITTAPTENANLSQVFVSSPKVKVDEKRVAFTLNLKAYFLAILLPFPNLNVAIF
jgi:hypothetical protein